MTRPLLVAMLWAYAFLANSAFGSEKAPVEVAAKGKTEVTADFGKKKIRVAITAHEVLIGDPSVARPAIVETSCTYSRFPCSVVNRIEISVNTGAVFVPRSVYADLADVNSFELSSVKTGFALTLHGGDGSEAYRLVVVFDGTEIKKRTLYSELDSDKPIQETTYYSQPAD
ncbi:hypothetical protein [Hydrocarboniphaga sp.]|uniref:hypothetical protein n=1 Tax=Hydrocarboniphaga sp. TaxID=2033016 RepID=UPI003D0B67D0